MVSPGRGQGGSWNAKDKEPSLSSLSGGGKDTTPAIGGQGTARKGSGDVAAVEGANANASANDAESRSVNGKATSRAQMLMMAVETMGGNVHAMSVESGLGVYVGNVGAERAQREGYGIVVYKRGHLAAGQMRKGRLHGIGTRVERDGSRYEGMFRNGRKHGYGTEVTQMGEIHMGQYRMGERHGTGMVFTSTPGGEQVEALGLWSNGKIVGDLVEFQDGKVYKVRVNTNGSVTRLEDSGDKGDTLRTANLGRSAHDSAKKGDNASSCALAIIGHMQPLIDMHEAGLGILEADGGLVEAELKPLRDAYRERDRADGGSKSRGAQQAWPAVQIPDFFGHVTVEHMRMWQLLENVAGEISELEEEIEADGGRASAEQAERLKGLKKRAASLAAVASGADDVEQNDEVEEGMWEEHEQAELAEIERARIAELDKERMLEEERERAEFERQREKREAEEKAKRERLESERRAREERQAREAAARAIKEAEDRAKREEEERRRREEEARLAAERQKQELVDKIKREEEEAEERARRLAAAEEEAKRQEEVARQAREAVEREERERREAEQKLLDDAEVEKRRRELEAMDAAAKEAALKEERGRSEEVRRMQEEADWESAEQAEREMREREEWPAKLRSLRYDLIHESDHEKRLEIGKKIDEGNRMFVARIRGEVEKNRNSRKAREELERQERERTRQEQEEFMEAKATILREMEEREKEREKEERLKGHKEKRERARQARIAKAQAELNERQRKEYLEMVKKDLAEQERKQKKLALEEEKAKAKAQATPQRPSVPSAARKGGAAGSGRRTQRMALSGMPLTNASELAATHKNGLQSPLTADSSRGAPSESSALSLASKEAADDLFWRMQVDRGEEEEYMREGWKRGNHSTWDRILSQHSGKKKAQLGSRSTSRISFAAPGK